MIELMAEITYGLAVALLILGVAGVTTSTVWS